MIDSRGHCHSCEAVLVTLQILNQFHPVPCRARHFTL